MSFKLYKGTLFIFCSIFIAVLAGCPIPGSDPVDDIIPSTAPGEMLAPTLEDGNGQLIAAWAATENDGSEITGYTLRHSADGGNGYVRDVPLCSRLQSKS
ncbi:MAG: hypothetical protein ACR2PY_08400 [Salinispira sp.]